MTATMQISSVGYRFIQRFSVPAREAFEWCTDYRPEDLALMGEKGKRRIKRLTKDTIILEEVVAQEDGRIRKVKLVRLNPRTLSWHNIQLQGPNKYSEFIYEIVAEGERKSRLDFTGLLVVYTRNPLTGDRLRQIADRERKYDSRAWKLLARAMAKELLTC